MGHLPKKTEFGYLPALALFEKPSINSGIIAYKWVQYRPISQISNSGLLQFTISGTSNDYVNLQNSYLQLKGYIANSRGVAITQKDDVAFENLGIQSLWSQVDISLQQKVISSRVGTNYAYKSYLDVLLNSSLDQMENQLTSQLFYRDTAGLMDGGNGNAGYRLRKRFTENGEEIQLEGPLYLDICQQERPILNGVEINLKFWPNKPSFFLSSIRLEKGYYFKITDATLNVCMVEVSPAILVGHAAALKESPALYPFHQSDFKAFSIPKGQYEHSIDNIFQGDIPSDLTVALVSSQAYIGSYNKNPFNFDNYDCAYCGFFINGISTPSQPFEPLYNNDAAARRRFRRATPITPKKTKPSKPSKPANAQPGEGDDGGVPTTVIPKSEAYMNAYLSLFGQKYASSTDIPISRLEFPHGFCIYKFQIGENIKGEESDFISIPHRGHTRLTLKFKEALPESVTVIVYAHFPRILQIDETRNVVF